MAVDAGIRALNDLTAIYHDSEEGYAKAAKGVHDTARSNRLTEVSGSRDALAQDLMARREHW